MQAATPVRDHIGRRYGNRRFPRDDVAGSDRGEKLVVATGGKSIPKMGSTGFAYRLAEQFGLSWSSHAWSCGH